MLSSEDFRLLRALSSWADVAGPVCDCLARWPLGFEFEETAVCVAADLPTTQHASVLGLLRDLATEALIVRVGELRWKTIREPAAYIRLALLLDAVRFYQRDVHVDSSTVRLALTRPGKPSQLEAVLRAMGFADALMDHTAEGLLDIAEAAKVRLVAMTPFLDIRGAEFVEQLLKRARPSVQKTLILRFINSTNQRQLEGLPRLEPTLADLNVEVLDYAIARPTGGIETFHAKVVLADYDYAYVGSANMLGSSIETSMELGMLLKGEAALHVSKVVDSVIRVCGQTETRSRSVAAS
jgi:phosphatidylserine/phosphatidylglycerophosphate/cardiolipin synthase-like enzyme